MLTPPQVLKMKSRLHSDATPCCRAAYRGPNILVDPHGNLTVVINPQAEYATSCSIEIVVDSSLLGWYAAARIKYAKGSQALPCAAGS